ncbi:PH domain-containing protein [Ornithinimicrobium panacihumi]|uniref:PH domain-containing protein n=1 Tax=Ornithinimicrobium panacihumi TaxID=2008449 RepID=UPI003F8B64AF
MARQETMTGTRWGLPRWFRIFAIVFATVTLVVLGLALVGGRSQRDLLAPGLNVLTASCILLMARMGTSADADGLRVTNIATRTIPWHDVADLAASKNGRPTATVHATLRDGRQIPLAHVTLSELRHLEGLRPGPSGTADTSPLPD